ncbi:Sugar transferase involved in LPS biosynthesis (colanic, teichoic acid) [Aliiroseovarius halocynthiae]|uniref:Sugar transferase n=1 Tax=Aliiroseovarius halocynthiae TaxID=985055 RepID=A0A545SUL7_9RHOB|nr:sugar transferase [Aliiroseovarius halocynthiae]TQV68659.1 sugar transferase [Aliiroseovarius halocynthiae]SMR71079.1 Sugar transferase involved in LPS biosynthesis (colanic, teichoic acid) [Aliiroseovarius halocynthiae]
MNRLLEILICLCMLVIAIPLCAVTYLIVVRVLGRPVMFHQTRAGKGGVPFEVVKFRTLTDDRDAHGVWLPDEERLTPPGKFLRRMRFDELPQLFIILAGRMALVGPRPLMVETIEGFGPEGVIRGSVRPGLTGWSQVSGNTALSDDEKLQLDLWYVAHRSTALDFRILAETFGVALFGEHRREDRIAAAQTWGAAPANTQVRA